MVELFKGIYLVGGGDYGISDSADCNTYLVSSKGELALIETGSGMNTEQIIENIRLHRFNVADIETIILTHSHFDHSGGAHQIKKLSGAKVCIHRDEAKALRNFDPKTVGLEVARKLGGPYSVKIKSNPCPVDKELIDQDILKVGTVELRVIHTPGHTKGSICLIGKIGSKTTLFTGDSMFSDLAFPFMNIPGSNLTNYLKSMKRLFKELRREKVKALFPGHRCFMVDNAHAKLESYKQKLEMPFISIGTPK